jgi:hypothetical protein
MLTQKWIDKITRDDGEDISVIGPPAPMPDNKHQNEILVQITAPHFCAGIVLTFKNGSGWRVTETAPIVRYMKGWLAWRVKAYVARKGWKAVRVDKIPVS